MSRTVTLERGGIGTNTYNFDVSIPSTCVSIYGDIVNPVAFLGAVSFTANTGILIKSVNLRLPHGMVMGQGQYRYSLHYTDIAGVDKGIILPVANNGESVILKNDYDQPIEAFAPSPYLATKLFPTPPMSIVADGPLWRLGFRLIGVTALPTVDPVLNADVSMIDVSGLMHGKTLPVFVAVTVEYTN